MPDGIQWTPPWDLAMGSSPLVATALHGGTDLSPGVGPYLCVDEVGRSHARDPFAQRWAGLMVNRVIVHRSRYEIDLDEARDEAIPMDRLDPDGRPYWHDPPPREVFERSLALYDRFYDDIAGYLKVLVSRYGEVLLLDLRCRCVVPSCSGAIRLWTPTPGSPQAESSLTTLVSMLRDAAGHLTTVSRARVRPRGVFLPWATRRFGPRLSAISIHVDAPAGPAEGPLQALGRAVELALQSSLPQLDTCTRGRPLARAAGR